MDYSSNTEAVDLDTPTNLDHTLFDAMVSAFFASIGTPQTRLCKGKCGETKPLTEFGKEMGSVGLKKTKCKVCLNQQSKTSKLAKMRLGPIKTGHHCVCDKTYRGEPTGRSWVPDHDHDTGNPRDWLCRECNTTLGKMRDDPNILIALALYLTRFGKSCNYTIQLKDVVATSQPGS
jgi:Recombination endonuclease VII